MFWLSFLIGVVVGGFLTMFVFCWLLELKRRREPVIKGEHLPSGAVYDSYGRRIR